jgi:hypothetical protein
MQAQRNGHIAPLSPKLWLDQRPWLNPAPLVKQSAIGAPSGGMTD